MVTSPVGEWGCQTSRDPCTVTNTVAYIDDIANMQTTRVSVTNYNVNDVLPTRHRLSGPNYLDVGQ